MKMELSGCYSKSLNCYFTQFNNTKQKNLNNLIKKKKNFLQKNTRRLNLNKLIFYFTYNKPQETTKTFQFQQKIDPNSSFIFLHKIRVLLPVYTETELKYTFL